MNSFSKTQTYLRILFLFLSFLYPYFFPFEYKAATSYTNAKEFYESTASNGQFYHSETTNGTIYYATCAKLATDSSNLHYATVGFDIELSTDQHQVSFTVQRTGNSMQQIGDPIRTNGYEYILYSISSATLFDLATKANPFEASYILNASSIHVTLDAILITKQGNTLSGGIKEDGSGGFTKWGTIYRLKNTSDLSNLKRIFSGHEFKSYYDITSFLTNNQLHIRYQVQGLNSTSSTSATVGNGFSIQDGFLFKNGTTYIQKQTLLQQTTLLNQNAIALEKTGYHLASGNEWIRQDYRSFSTTNTYMPIALSPLVGQQNHGLTLYANWQPNSYTVSYDSNGGTGTVATSSFTYDQATPLRANTFSKPGFYLEEGKEWNTKADGSGTCYGSNQLVSNLTSDHGATLTLYANWKPNTVSITTDKNGGSGGTDIFYQNFNVGFFSDKALSSPIHSIILPERIGYRFSAYYPSIYPSSSKIIDETGALVIPNTYFLKNAIIYADYTPNTYTLFFDKQGGTGGSDSVNPVFDKSLPFAEAPVKTGATFKGYFTQPNGEGTLYYNEFMASNLIYETASDMTLYAYWVDETPPEAYLTSNYDNWTNRTITLSAFAIDYDSGLDSLALYLEDELVAEYKALNGQMQKTFTYSNSKEGVLNYRLLATDKSGNTSEVSKTVYYDKKAPEGQILQHTEISNTVSFSVFVTDIHVP